MSNGVMEPGSSLAGCVIAPPGWYGGMLRVETVDTFPKSSSGRRTKTEEKGVSGLDWKLHNVVDVSNTLWFRETFTPNLIYVYRNTQNNRCSSADLNSSKFQFPENSNKSI